MSGKRLCTSMLIMLLFLCSCGKPEQATTKPESETKSNGTASERDPLGVLPKPTVLTVDDVLGWRSQCGGDLIGKSKDTVVERYGIARTAESTELSPGQGEWLAYDPSPKIGERAVCFLMVAGTLHSIKVFAKDQDLLAVEEVIKKAPSFHFNSGRFKDSVQNYFSADTSDNRNSLQFQISDQRVRFWAAIFSNP